MKTILPTLFLTCLGLWAQTSSPTPATNALIATVTNREAVLSAASQNTVTGAENVIRTQTIVASASNVLAAKTNTASATNVPAAPLEVKNPPAVSPAAPLATNPPVIPPITNPVPVISTNPLSQNKDVIPPSPTNLPTALPAMTNPVPTPPIVAPTVTPPQPAAPIPPAPQTKETTRSLQPPPIATTPPPLSLAPPPAPSKRTIPPTPGGSTTARTPAALGADDIIPAGNINFQAVDLNQILMVYAELVGRTILRPANLSSPPIVLKTQTPLTKKEAIQALDAVLALNSIAMINVGDKFVKAVPVQQANQEGATWSKLDASQLPDMGQYVTHIVQTKYVKPSELVQAIQPFAKLPNAILPIDSSQILVLRDNTENVKRMLEMIEKIDVTVQSEFVNEVIPIKYALASDIANALSSLSGGGGGTTIGTRSTAGRTTATTGTTGTTTTRPGQPGYVPGQPQASTTPAGTPSSTSSFSSRLQQIVQRAASGSGGEIQIIGVTKIIPDERTNSLLVFASRQDMETIKDIISKLDVVLAQVLIETIIMDVGLDHSWNYGVTGGQQPKQVNSHTNNLVGGILNNDSGQLSTGQGFLQSLLQNTVGSTSNLVSATYPSGSGLSYFGTLGVGPSFDLALQAAASDSTVNVIQKPRILTSHATPASIFVGNTVPYITSSYYGGGYNGGPSSSYQQLSVGIGLNVTPFINPDGLVVMKIDESIDEISGSTAITGVGNVPNTTHRSLSAEVAVRDRETIILGGFIRNSDSKSRSGVPLLQDIPLLGNLFTSRGSTKERKELLVLMRPTVLKTPDLAALHVAEEKKRLPGVSQAEADIGADERKAIQREQKRKFRETTPVAPEEEKFFYNKPMTNLPPLVAP